MSDFRDLDQLRGSLDEALRTINPGPAPVHAAVRRGKGIRARRRLTAFAGITAVIVAAIAGYPALTHKQPAPAPRPPVTPRHAASVTDVFPGPRAARGVIASGTIYGAPWQVVTGQPGTNGLPKASAPGQHCFAASGSAIGLGEPLRQCLRTPVPTAAAPVAFTGFAVGSRAQASIGQVLADVRYVTVDLSDGTKLTLIPARVDGTRYVAFATPETLTVDSASAYLSTGQILTAIPFNIPKSLVMFGLWQRPGQAGPARITRIIGTAPDPQAWWATAYAGPWGTCLADTSYNSVSCMPTAAPLGTDIMVAASTEPFTVFGSAAADVSYLKLTLTDGTTRRVSAVAVGRQKFFAFLGNGSRPRKWTAYNAAGKAVSSGGLPR